MTNRNPIPDGTVLVAIDVAKNRNEVLIDLSGGKRRRSLVVLNTRDDHDRLIALAPKPAGQREDVIGQPLLVRQATGDLAL